MQKVDGLRPRNVVASELAAMFTFAVLPTLRQHYFNPEAGLDWEQYRDQCKALAEELGLEEEEWHKITLPCLISIDNDAKHAWLRELIAVPGRNLEDLAALDESTFSDLGLGQVHHEASPAEPASDLFGSLDAVGRQEHVAKVQRLHEEEDVKRRQADVVRRRRDFTDQIRAREKYDPLLRARFEKSREDQAYITAVPVQVMPLVKVTPDIHSPIEHMVGTVKRHVKRQMLAMLLKKHGELKKGRTYQRFIENAVRERGNGEAGHHHISSSIYKQEIICRVLAAPVGEPVVATYVPYKERQAETPVARQVTLLGTAGRWILKTKWT